MVLLSIMQKKIVKYFRQVSDPLIETPHEKNVVWNI